MIIREVLLQNFRRYERASFCFHERFTILIGENGKGKTSILDALAIMLATYFQGSGIKIGQNTISKSDRRLVQIKKGDQSFLEPQEEVYVEAKAFFRKEELVWMREVGDRGGKAKDLVNIGSEDRSAVSKGESPDLPLFLYYGSGRLWDIHRNVQTEKPGSQLDAYRFCLDPKSDQKAFEKWFKKLTQIGLQKKKPPSALNVVKKAVLDCIPDADDVFFDFDNDQLVIELSGGGWELFNRLSDGYRNMIAMVADIAHRAVRLNPHYDIKAAIKTKGVILIDEIDLHLHPKWQRRVVDDLQKAFPNIQFIASTHSPFIIQSSAKGGVIDLNRSPEAQIPKGIYSAFPGPESEYENRSIEDIAEEIMGIEVPSRSHRYQEMYDTAKEYYQLLETAKDAESSEQIKVIKSKLDELSAPYSDNVAYHAFLEIKRIKAGLANDSLEGE